VSCIAGDLGGQYGLFLGGSAISIFEVFDVIIYNGLLKLSRKISSRKVAAEKTVVEEAEMTSVNVM